jgi:hypothetical protein
LVDCCIAIFLLFCIPLSSIQRVSLLLPLLLARLLLGRETISEKGKNEERSFFLIFAP